MKKKNIFLILTVITILLFKIDVKAANACDSKNLKELKDEAMYTEVLYELVKPTHPDDIIQKAYYYDIIISNASAKFYYKVGSFNYDYSNSKNNEIRIKEAFQGGGFKVKIEIYGSSRTFCENELIKTIYVNLPYYNFYSEREECKDYQDYDICKFNANTSKISEEEFLNTIDYIKNKKQDEKPIIEEEKDNIFTWYWKNKIVTIPVTIVLVLLIIVLIINIKNKKKKKIKIDLGGKL